MAAIPEAKTINPVTARNLISLITCTSLPSSIHLHEDRFRLPNSGEDLRSGLTFPQRFELYQAAAPLQMGPVRVSRQNRNVLLPAKEEHGLRPPPFGMGSPDGYVPPA